MKNYMIAGKYLTDSDIHIDFINKNVNIDYGYPVYDKGILYIVRILLLPFLFFIWSIFLMFHFFIMLPYISRFKFFNQVSYLNSMNILYKTLFGFKVAYFEGEHDSTQIFIHSSQNLEFKYKLTGDYEKYCTSINLYADDVFRNWHGNEYCYFSGWFFVITFSQIPKLGTAKIEYL